MTSKDLTITGDEQFFENQFKVIELFVQAENPTAIAKKLGMKRKDVLDYIDKWRESSVVNDVLQGRVEELVQNLDEHYSLLIRKAWEIISDADNSDRTHQVMAQKNSAIKTIAELEDKRIAVLQRSGMLEDKALADEIAELERQRDILLELLENGLCDNCQTKVRRAIGEVLGQPQVLTVYAD